SVGGVLTGRGADIIIIDDPLKPEEALSQTQRRAANEWFDHTLYSRLNDAHSGDGDRQFQPKAIIQSGDRHHGRSTGARQAMTAQRPVGGGVSTGCRISRVWSSDRRSVTASIFGWPHLRGLGAAGEDAGNQYSPSLIASETAGRLNRDELIEV